MKTFIRIQLAFLTLSLLASCASQKHYAYLKLIKVGDKVSPSLIVSTSKDISVLSNNRTIILKSGSNIELSLSHSVSSGSAQQNSQVEFQVVNDVKVGQDVVISHGEIAKGTVTQVQTNGALGKQGSISIHAISTQAVDGTFIPINSDTLSASGSSNLALAIILAVLFCWTLVGLLFLLIKGTNATLVQGASSSALVTSDTEVTIEK